MLTKFTTVLAPTPTDLENWRFFLGLFTFVVLYLLTIVVLLEGIGDELARRVEQRRARQAADPMQDQQRRRQLDALVAIHDASLENGRRIH